MSKQETTMRTTLLATTLAFLMTTPALAGPCGFDEVGRLVIKGYAIGATAVPEEQKPRLTEFAEIPPGPKKPTKRWHRRAPTAFASFWRHKACPTT